MDNETRGMIAKMLDDNVKKLSRKDSSPAITGWFSQDVLMEDIALDWVSKDSKELSADLASGYVIGYLASQAHQIIIQRKWREAVSKIYSNRVKETSGADSEKKQKTIYIRVTNDDVKEIREMLKPKIPLIRKEVYRALSL